MSSQRTAVLCSADFTVTRVFEPSRIRRGRRATSPVWYVTKPNGERWRFMLKEDAAAFVKARAECPEHVPGPWTCRRCGGRREWVTDADLETIRKRQAACLSGACSKSPTPEKGRHEMADCYDLASEDRAVLLAEVERLRAALREACQEFEDASPYKGEFLAKKHGDANTLKRLRSMLGDQ